MTKLLPRRRTHALAALAMLVAVPWAVQQAAAHPYWPPRPTVTPLKCKSFMGQTQKLCRVEVEFTLGNPPAAAFFEYGDFTTMGLNWCRAKKNLPAGWNTQDNRRLRTDSMCREDPYYGSLGLDYPFSGVGKIKWTTPDHIGATFGDGRWIFSINGWSQGAHHAGGNHTTLHLFTLDVPDGNLRPKIR